MDKPSDTDNNFITIQKMAFIYNALEKGWKVEKLLDKYIFTKPHEGKKEIFLDSYIGLFVRDNLKMDHIFQ